ncbi:MAG: AIPR family protein [Lachnospiraceae bacterium]|nr:AIPR family protein [Lachnospiraceae bacterium]
MNKKGNLERRLFDSNVRDYLGLNPVNRDILNSLKKCEGPDFWWLNNGITIIGSKATIVGNSISITDVQIVNGLQTSESIYQYLSGEASESVVESDSRSVLIKVIVSTDKEINDSIIYATNNQTNVNVTALRATDKIQKDIEKILKTNGIYYERKTHFYENQGMTKESIITPLSIAAGYICLIYKNPIIATSLKQKFMRDNRKYEKVFSASSDIKVWVPIAILLKKTDKYLSELRVKIKGNIFKLQKNYRQIIVFVTVSRIMGTFAFGENALITMDLKKYTKGEVEKTVLDLMEVDPNCFSRTRKPKSSFYSAVYTAIERKYGIKAIQSKKRLLLSDNALEAGYDLPKDFLDDVVAKLPSQPWPWKIHESIAENMGVSTNKVSYAISYLIYSHRLKHQVYGYVFDDDDNVICEGEHFNRSIEDARAKLKELKAIYERRFWF